MSDYEFPRTPRPVEGIRRFSFSLVAALFVCSRIAAAQAPAGGPFEATPQRPTFTSDTATTAPGTMELETGGTFTGDFFAWPIGLKFTPEVRGGLLHGTEFSVGFRGLVSTTAGGMRMTDFGDQFGFAVRRPVYAGKSFSFAVAPRASFFLRGDRGARLGLTGLAAWQVGSNSLVGNFAWTGATSPSESNPRHLYEVSFDFARPLGSSQLLRRLFVFAGFLSEHSSDGTSTVSLGQGITYRLRPDSVLDLAVQELGMVSGEKDYRILVGLTVNLGRMRDW